MIDPEPTHSTGGDARPVVLDVRGARRSFGGTPALSGVNLSLRSHQILALLGTNGAGKTTLLRAICGRVKLDAGEVVLVGGDPRSQAAARKQLGLVPQSIALYPHLNARENLEVFARLAGMAKRDIPKRVSQVLTQVGLAERSESRAGQLSGGMQRRLNIAAGVLHKPTALLLDEPTVGVDPQARVQIHRLLRGLRDSGLAILLTTHDLEEASELADWTAFMSKGQIVLEGVPEELVRETFGHGQELSVTLTTEPDDAGRTLLKAQGLTAAIGPRVWGGRLHEGLAGLSSVEATLSAAGLTVAEIRVRQPDLRGVFFHITGEELQS